MVLLTHVVSCFFIGLIDTATAFSSVSWVLQKIEPRYEIDFTRRRKNGRGCARGAHVNTRCVSTLDAHRGGGGWGPRWGPGGVRLIAQSKTRAACA
jgi:hypothetical protein